GRVLISGGFNGTVLNSAELYSHGSFADARRPTVSAIAATVGQPTRLTLSGSGFQGDSEGSGGGFNNSATNYPLFLLQRVDNDQAVFVAPEPVAGWSATSFQTGTLYGMPAGYYRASVVANAVPSLAQLVRIAPAQSIAPTVLDFPEATVDVTSAPQAVTITNTGSSDLLFGAKLFTPNDGRFSIVAGDTCLGALPPGASCAFNVVFLTHTSGNATASLAIQTSDPDTPVTTLALSGSAAAITVPLTITFTGTGTGTVLVRPEPPGSSCTADCSQTFNKDTLVTLVPRADVGSLFAGWSGCDSVAGTTCMVTMTGARGVTANLGLTSPGVYVAIATGNYHSLALKGDGLVWAWGYNYLGQLGNGSTGDLYTPVQVAGLSGVTAIAAGYFHSIALKSDGTVWTWGNNSDGQLGDGSTGQSAAPIQVAGLSGVTAIAGGGSHTVALKGDGTVWAWGNNGDGQLGNGTTGQSVTPVQVTGLTDVVAIAAVNAHTVALKSDGTVWTWGN
ncbi:MAG TPA: choice-of-anchor D domain-containing protein, partial [Geobacteraceae bacterium]